MPIEFAPPPPNFQGFNIPPPPHTDPLQTLAQIGQLQQGAMQRQATQMALQQQQMKLESQQGLMKAWMASGGDLTKLEKVVGDYGVLPEDFANLQKHFADLAHTRAQTKLYGSQSAKEQQEADDKEHDFLYGQYRGAFDEKDPVKQKAVVDAVNARLTAQGWKKEKLIDYTGPDSVSLARSAYTTLTNLRAEAEIAAKNAERTKAETENIKLGQEVQSNTRAQAIAELQGMQRDEQGRPLLTEWTPYRTKYAEQGLKIPETYSALWEKDFKKSGVPAKDQPEYDLNTLRSLTGMMGNAPFDQFMANEARKLGRPLSTEEWDKAFTRYNIEHQDPVMRALAVGMKGLQEQALKTQIASVPGQDDIEMMARQLWRGDMSPDDLRQFRTRYGNAAIQAIRRADEIVNAEGNPLFPGQPFSIANLQTALDTRDATEKKFSTGPEAQMIRSFGNLMEHALLGDEARQALYGKNAMPVLRRIANAIGVAIGDTPQTAYDTIADFIAKEATKAFQPGGGGVEERKESAWNFSRSLGDKQLKENYRVLMLAVDAQRQGFEEQYERGTFGKGLNKGRLFPQRALDARDKLMGRPPAKTAGGPPTVTTQAQYDALPPGTIYLDRNGHQRQKPKP